KSGIELGGGIISSNQKELETLENFECIEGRKVCSCTQKNSEDVCIKWLCSCNFETLPDLLFLFLNSKYSATISILDKLSSSEASARVNNAKTLCPSCVIALEHEPLLKIKNDTNLTQLYFSGANSLNSSISNYFKVQFPQKEEDWGFPPKFLNNEAQARLKNVDIIVLNLDLSDKAPSSDLKEKKKYYLDTAKKAAQVSRYILIHVGKPSIWKLRFPTNKAFSDTAYFDPIFFDNLFSIEQELTLSGVVGVLLPSLFEKDENVLNTVDEVTSNKFINLVNGSLSFLQFSADSSTLLINAKDKSCADLCSECPLSDKSLCKSECDDGSSCPNGQCPQNCISISYCSNNLCEEKFKTKKIVCYYMPSKQKYYENIKRFELNSMEELISNYDFPTIVGSLNQKCCINISSKEKEAYYTFFSHPIFSYHAEEAVYPHFGANTTSCGKTVIENVEQQQCDPKAPPELSYSSTLYYCYWADK
ncbi:MAG: hypothetical protein N3D10_02370, partial [Candidatus Micrarchaeota archaeon]|nr:hypothetical protein [Candidatus Micrarchaeota archaeon]